MMVFQQHPRSKSLVLTGRANTCLLSNRKGRKNFLPFINFDHQGAAKQQHLRGMGWQVRTKNHLGKRSRSLRIRGESSIHKAGDKQ
jgi:hypothetical protein